MTAKGMLILLAVIALAVTAGFLLVVAGEDESAGPERADTLRRVLEDPEAHLGKVATLSGEIQRLEPDVGEFTIGERPDAQENELFVVLADGSRFKTSAVDGDSVVRVHGRIKRVFPPESTDDDGLHDDTEDDALDEFEGELAIEASRIDLLRR